MQNLQISKALHLILEHLRFDFTHLIILQQARDEVPLWETLTHKQTLRRKGYLTEKNTLTNTGRLLLIELEAELNKGSEEQEPETTLKKIKEQVKFDKQQKEEWFRKFWDSYPRSTTWTDEKSGREFPGGRPLRDDKARCRGYFFKEMDCGVNPQEIIDAILYDVEKRKKASLATGRNMLDSLKGSPAWLYQRTFEPILEMMAEEKKQRTLSTMQSLKEKVTKGSDFL